MFDSIELGTAVYRAKAGKEIHMDREIRDRNGLTLEEYLASFKAGNYPRPSVTADIMVFSQEAESWRLLMIRRGGHPFLGCFALPGGFAEPGETVDQSAQRELMEETHVEGLSLAPVGLFSDPDRDPRGWTVTNAYLTVAPADLRYRADDDAAEAAWFAVSVEKNVEEYHLKLTNTADPSCVLTAVLSVRPRRTVLGEVRDIHIMQSDGIAFDHAKIILEGFLRLTEADLR